MRKLTAVLMTLVLLVSNSAAASAKPKGDWNDVKASMNQTIAVKTKNGDTRFGIVRFADDSEIRIQCNHHSAAARLTAYSHETKYRQRFSGEVHQQANNSLRTPRTEVA